MNSVGNAVARRLFLVTILVGSFLLFLTQPMIARMALPRVGGAPAVWNSAMLVYQALLLAGYGYAHLVNRLGPRLQAGLHLALFALAALWLPIGLGSALLPADAEPAFWVPWFLISGIGPLFFIVSAQAPLMQRWYAMESARGEPYALFAASNLGSFAGLIAYPFLVEPLLSLSQQRWLWTAGYGLLVLLVAGCAFTIPERAVERHPVRGERPAMASILHWIVLAAVPSGLMLSTTAYLTTDLVAIPLLWVLPLGLYLLSFVAAFAVRRRPAELITRVAPLILVATALISFSDDAQSPQYAATFELLLLFCVAVALHAQMYRLRPAPEQLTHFYLAMAVGGMLGGIFCAIVAPLIFDWTWEHPLLLLAAAGLIPQRPLLRFLTGHMQGAAGRWLKIMVPLAAILISLLAAARLGPVSETIGTAGGFILILIALVTIGRRAVFAACLAALMLCYGGWNSLDESLVRQSRTRSYFGVYTINDYDDGYHRYRSLTHGTTEHGVQILDPELRRLPTTYFAPRSGVGLGIRMAEGLYGKHARIGVAGLGAGTLACLARPGQSWRFFEIDPVVQGLAVASGKFTFMRDCAPSAHVVIGDARLSLSRQPPGGLDILALDAFSSDVVPMHLLTREAFDVYARALQPAGLLLVHISNLYVDLEPVIAAAARGGGWEAAILDYDPTLLEVSDQQAAPSVWVALSRDPHSLAILIAASMDVGGQWVPLRERPGFIGWSDDHASILPLLKTDAFRLELGSVTPAQR